MLRIFDNATASRFPNYDLKYRMGKGADADD